MKKQLFNFLFLILLSASVSAQTATKPDLAEQNLRKHVIYLASDKLEGRRTGERGATFAAGYVANMFSNYRLKGGFVETKNGKLKLNLLQPFPFATGATLGAGNRLMTTTPNSNTVLDLKSDWMPFGASPDVDASYADAVFVRYGIVSDEQKRDDYAGKNVSGRVVYAFDGTPDKNNPHDSLSQFGVYAKAKIAKDKGAIALILISREQNFADDKSSAISYDPTLGETAVPVAFISRAIAAKMFGGAAEMQKAETGATENERAIKAQIKINLDKKSGEGYNVIGVLDGTDPALKNEAIIIGAHYDHLGRGGQGSLAANSTEIHHGADDDASGVAALIELARQFSLNKNNRRTIIFIAFGGEEEGLLGSKFYVNNPVFPLAKTVAMINMDMIGRLKDYKLTIGGIGTASEWKGLVEKINMPNSFALNTRQNQEIINNIETALRRKNLCCVTVEIGSYNVPVLKGIVEMRKMAVTVLTAEEAIGRPVTSELTESSTVQFAPLTANIPFILQLNEDGFGPSDHSSFYSKQIPVLFFSTGTHLDYHKPSDTADKINLAGLNQIVNYVSEIVKAIDGNPQRPTYTVAKSTETGEGRRGFNVSLGTIPTYTDAADGLVLDGVRDDSPAAKAGLKMGDKIVKLAGKDVRNISDYTIILGELKPDVEYEIVVTRAGQTLNLKIIPAARK